MLAIAGAFTGLFSIAMACYSYHIIISFGCTDTSVATSTLPKCPQTHQPSMYSMRETIRMLDVFPES